MTTDSLHPLTSSQLSSDQKDRFDELNDRIDEAKWDIHTVICMGSVLGALFEHRDSRQRVSKFLDGTSVSDAGLAVVEGTMPLELFMQRLEEARSAAPAVPKPQVDVHELWRRDLVHYGPNPMDSQMGVRLYLTLSHDRPFGMLRFRPEGFARCNFAETSPSDAPYVTAQSYRVAWDEIVAAGFQTEGDDYRFGDRVPLNAVLDLGTSHRKSPPRVKAAAEQWRSYLTDPDQWHARRGESRRAYQAIYVSGGNTDWLGNVKVWRFWSHCPPKDLYGLRSVASDGIADDTYDHYKIKLVLEANQMEALAQDILVGDEMTLKNPVIKPDFSIDASHRWSEPPL